MDDYQLTKHEVYCILKGLEFNDIGTLLAFYARFIRLLENTPTHMQEKATAFQRGLHAAIGLSTEAGEVLDLFKKELYGKEVPFTQEALNDEAGDVFFYLMLLLDSQGSTLRNLIRTNITKLALRYALKLPDDEPIALANIPKPTDNPAIPSHTTQISKASPIEDVKEELGKRREEQRRREEKEAAEHYATANFVSYVDEASQL